MSVISIFEGAYFASPRENKGLIDKAKHDLDMFTFRNVDPRINEAKDIIVGWYQLVPVAGHDDPTKDDYKQEWIPCKVTGHSTLDAKIIPTSLNATGIKWTVSFFTNPDMD
jgi:hypothetical protein